MARKNALASFESMMCRGSSPAFTTMSRHALNLAARGLTHSSGRLRTFFFCRKRASGSQRKSFVFAHNEKPLFAACRIFAGVGESDVSDAGRRRSEQNQTSRGLMEGTGFETSCFAAPF
jgi:hypothetical protein